MSPRPTHLGELARRDAELATAYYLETAGPKVARAFSAELRVALRHIREQPGTGSPRYAQQLDLPGLRHWHLRGFPYLVFYVEDDRIIDVWRILHAQRDIAAWLQEPG